MKLPKTIKRLCPFCRKHTVHKVANQRHKGLNRAHPMSRWSATRVRARGLRRGHGNYGRFSRPPIAQWKMTGAKASKKTDLRYTCEKCKKTHAQSAGIRAKKIEFS